MKKFNLYLFFIELSLFLILIIPFSYAGGNDKTPADTSNPEYEDTFAEGAITLGFKALLNKKLAVRSPDNACHVIINSAGKSYFVPTKTDLEWKSFLVFLDSPNSGLSLVNCKEKILQIINEYETNQGVAIPTTVKEAALSGDTSGLSVYEQQLALTLINIAATDEGIRINDAVLADEQRDFRFYTSVNFYSEGDIIYPPYPYGNYGSDWPDDPYFYPDPGSDEYNDLKIRLQQMIDTDYPNEYAMDSIRLLLRFSDQAATIKDLEADSSELEILNQVNRINAQTLADNIANNAFNPDDSDGDGWTNSQEINIFGTDPDSADSAPLNEGGCFTAETLVKTLNGEKEISELKIGDSVLSYNPNNNKFVYSKIEKLLIHEDNTNWYYLIKTANSKVEVTDVHPFYIGNGLYSKIENLKIGDKIYVNVNGKLVQEEILSKERVDLPKLITVYNLELNKDGPRNYFANGYLVHNGENYSTLSITGKILVEAK